MQCGLYIRSMYTVYKDFPSPAVSDSSSSSPPTSVPYTHIGGKYRQECVVDLQCMWHARNMDYVGPRSCLSDAARDPSLAAAGLPVQMPARKHTWKMNENDGEIWLSDTFSRFRSCKIDEYGTFAESFAAIWSSFSNSTTRDEAADSCSTNCLNSNSSKLASLSTHPTDPTVTSRYPNESVHIASQLVLTSIRH